MWTVQIAPQGCSWQDTQLTTCWLISHEFYSCALVSVSNKFNLWERTNITVIVRLTIFTMFHKYTHTHTHHTQYRFIVKPANSLATFYFNLFFMWLQAQTLPSSFSAATLESVLTLVLSSSQRSSSSLPACPRLPISASLGFCGHMSAGTDISSSHADSKGRAGWHSFYVCLFNMNPILFTVIVKLSVRENFSIKIQYASWKN